MTRRLSFNALPPSAQAAIVVVATVIFVTVLLTISAIQFPLDFIARKLRGLN